MPTMPTEDAILIMRESFGGFSVYQTVTDGLMWLGTFAFLELALAAWPDAEVVPIADQRSASAQRESSIPKSWNSRRLPCEELGSMKDVFSRLRASKQKQSETDHREGFEAGRKWAWQTAEARELENLQAVKDGQDWDERFIENKMTVYGPHEVFVFTIQPENDGDRRSAREFWESIVGNDKTPVTDFVRGFADGAIKVWGEVKDEL
jgi:hypothetical protein